ncbi:aldehyde ferredoxin oxidoreductase family protein [Desulforhabdus amnigena]|jgi:aldehyde:ferredoxin oxidoreductase|uniref:Aldehyde ferredoxin oxidoreductase n=1 Tax=Desulforhabdus amnigena TaxID=40218 RepID=A0A9W6FQZ6_9BACT|nr:aldehyde ferredoxin oxidoreductase family protein [Desulforhabdus amnigena]NLJ27693.1 aldehyde ferredoxin oxidoreductase family protein [Deltaproteobacteria bacterium]GLI33017.1 aldehyde ferredoxin oxidoreductase [Desulforhabdus amnigena]
MQGFYGRILFVDLSSKTFRIEPIADEILSDHLGGKGLATKLLLDGNPPGVDPFSPENQLIFATGPFCQSRIWGASRYGVFTKSPLTGLYLESYSGGKVPEAIDAAGFDAVVFTGRAARPTVASIHPDGAELFDADDLWGADTFRTEEEAKARFAVVKDGYRKPGAVVIGPAGERLLRFAVIENDKWRSAGRGGVGAVMGSKRLKAVVFQGDRQRSLHDPEGVAEYCKAFARENVEKPGVKAYKALGTTMMVKIMNDAGAFPTRYWTLGTCEYWEKISGQTFHADHDVKPHACAKCFMACGRLATITKGRHKGLVIEGPEYETIYAFGGLCMIEEMEEVAYLNDICDRLGMDTITAGNLCAFTIEASRRGKVDYKIDYGDSVAIAMLLNQIAYRAGIGDILAEGIVHAAKTWGMEDVAVHVKGMEPAGYDPRVMKGMGLAYGTSDRGACHLRATFYKPELAGLTPRDSIEGKAELLIDYEDRLTIFDTLIFCRFYRDLYPWEELATLVELVTGLPSSKEQLRKTAFLIANLSRKFNLREGLLPEQDRLPKRLHREALPSGHKLTEEEMERMLADYYRLRGWDKEGIPVDLT